MHVYLNGRIVPARRATVSIFDHGFLYGDGVYETIRVVDGLSLDLTAHLKRLRQSARMIQIKVPRSSAHLKQSIFSLLKKNHLSNAAIRIFLSRGPGPYGFDIRRCTSPTLVITVEKFKGYPRLLYKKGMTAALVSIRRNHPRSVPPSAKTTNCLNGILAKTEATRLKAHEAIMLDVEGAIAEGSVSNVFVFRKGQFLTPKLKGNILPGVIRDRTCQMFRKMGFPVYERKVTPADLKKARHVFLTNSLMGIMPVRKLVWGQKGSPKTVSYQINPKFASV